MAGSVPLADRPTAPSRRARRGRVTAACAAGLALAAAFAAIAAGCGNKTPPRAREVRVDGTSNTPPILRGTIGTQARLTGDTPLLISGIGVVVGLDGTGGLPLPEQVATSVERDLALRGVGAPGNYAGTAFENAAPRRVLLDPNVAVVTVRGAVPPGTRTGDTVDVFVTALNATSLEGGRLLPTELRLGPAVAFGGPAARVMGEAGGDVFVNPFAPAADRNNAGVDATTGRILSGGTVREDINIRVDPTSPSHSRARAMVSAINSRFPRLPGERRETAVGERRGRAEVDVPQYEGHINVRVPERYRDQPRRFVEILRHLQVDQSLPQVYAREFSRELVRSPELGDELSWGLEAIGPQALPFIRELYEHEEVVPRLKALRAGAGLNDPQAVPPLVELARGGSTLQRIEAVTVLGELDSGGRIDPRIDTALTELLAAEQLTIRVAAYEAVAARAEREYARRLARVGRTASGPTARALSRDQIDTIAANTLPASGRRPVARVPVSGKFLLDRVPVGDPMIYITQQGIPRVVLFGRDLSIDTPAFVTAMGGRFTLVSDGPTDPHRLLYRQPSNNPNAVDLVRTERVGDSLVDLIDVLAGGSGSAAITPVADLGPGLDMSYSEIVAVLYSLYEAGAIDATFATERDRLVATLLASGDDAPILRRPLSPDDRREVVVFDEEQRIAPVDPATGRRRGDAGPGSLLEPIPQPDNRSN